MDLSNKNSLPPKTGNFVQETSEIDLDLPRNYRDNTSRRFNFCRRRSTTRDRGRWDYVTEKQSAHHRTGLRKGESTPAYRVVGLILCQRIDHQTRPLSSTEKRAAYTRTRLAHIYLYQQSGVRPNNDCVKHLPLGEGQDIAPAIRRTSRMSPGTFHLVHGRRQVLCVKWCAPTYLEEGDIMLSYSRTRERATTAAPSQAGYRVQSEHEFFSAGVNFTVPKYIQPKTGDENSVSAERTWSRKHASLLQKRVLSNTGSMLPYRPMACRVKLS